MFPNSLKQLRRLVLETVQQTINAPSLKLFAPPATWALRLYTKNGIDLLVAMQESSSPTRLLISSTSDASKKPRKL